MDPVLTNKNMNGLWLNNIYKRFGDKIALHNVSFKVALGEIVALLGPSGCGKSTLLSIIAGLEVADKGEISWNSESLRSLPPHKRGFGLMFQDFSLFPHKNVGANVAFGLRMAKWPQEKIDRRVHETLHMTGLSDYAHRDISTLSGGEQQRVALARSLAPHPKLLMLDEPLGSLDRTLRERLLAELGEILRSAEQTALYVTHDQEEAFALADRVVVMDQGKVAQTGTPQEIYRHPNSEFVARFLGFENIISGIFQDGRLTTEIGNFEIDELQTQWAGTPELTSQPATFPLLIRPDSMRLDSSGTHSIRGIVRESAFRGSLHRVKVDVEGTVLTFEFPSGLPLPEVEKIIGFSFNPEKAILILEANP